jgi:hypothetical protein
VVLVVVGGCVWCCVCGYACCCVRYVCMCIWDMFRTVSDLELDIDYVGGVVVV